MNTVQTGILPPSNPHACFLCINITDQSCAIKLLKQFSGLADQLASQHPEALLTTVIAIGKTLWDEISPNTKPLGFSAFQDVTNGNIKAPATPFDILIHIRSERHDLNFELAKQVQQTFGYGIDIVEEVYGFRYMDNRDLSGFVDGTENPEGDDRSKVALTTEAGELSQGSFVHIQRYVHKLCDWEALPVQDQEDIIGRTKDDNIEYASSDKPLTAHIKRANIKNDDGSSVEILRHSMPYGNTKEHGLFFISYSHRPDNFTRMLESMVTGDSHGHYDHLLKYTDAITGAAFYAPPVEFLLSLPES